MVVTQKLEGHTIQYKLYLLENYRNNTTSNLPLNMVITQKLKGHNIQYKLYLLENYREL